MPAIGDTKLSAHTFDHAGWILCDGRELKKSRYPRLYARVGDAFGSSNAMFRLPAAAGRVPGAAGAGAGLTSRALGFTTGEERHQLSVDELALHKHDLSGNTTGVTINSVGAHSHTSNATGGSIGLTQATNYNTLKDSDFSDNGELDLRDAAALTINEAGAHTHGVTDPKHTHTMGNTGGNVPHNNMQPTLFAGYMFIYGGAKQPEAVCSDHA